MTIFNNALLWLGWGAGLLFLGAYLIDTPSWWREEHRAHVVAFSGVVWLFYSLFLVRPWLPPAAYALVRLVLFAVLTAVVVWRLAIFWRGLRRRARERVPGAVP
jgi:hypothetical protein